MIRQLRQRRRIDDNGILNDGRLMSFIYKINISDGKLTPVSGWFAVGILAHIFSGKGPTFPESCKTSEQQQKQVLKKNKKRRSQP